MVMAGHSKAEIVSALKAAFDNKQLPDLENGNMVFMMSKSAYLYDDGDHNGPHLAGLDVSQTDVFHQFLLVSCDSENRSSSFCYQVVVRETKIRQLLHFFSLVRGICGSLICRMAAGSWARGCPVRAFIARACPELVEGAGSDAADATFVRSAQTPLRMRSWYPPFAKN
jgi:hypothetical protein